MRGDPVVTRRTGLFLSASLAVLANATLASAQAMPPPPPPPGEVAAQPAPPPPAPGPVALPAPPDGASGKTPPRAAPPYYPPPMMIGPSRLPYDETIPVPPGYEIQTRPRMGLVKAGLATLIPLYALSVLGGGVHLGAENGDAKEYGPLIIPVVGPFATMATSNSSGATPFLLLDGLGQMTGAALCLAGLFSSEKYLARQTATTNLRPDVAVGPKSMVLRWQF